jgi:hypothetical protein
VRNRNNNNGPQGPSGNSSGGSGKSDDVVRDAGAKAREGQGRAEDVKAHVKNQQSRTANARVSGVPGVKRV